ncbi:hypothetical protein CDL15_Pgr005611 [Punica granatum]|nr:hypothetical protein CDL15_Pgr005611 [Punica granatum]PKI60331.1 hypothetical protein CRG98_019267 [Punica granatum]
MDEENAVRRSIQEVQPNQTGFSESSDFSKGSNLLHTIQRQLEEGNIDKLSIEELIQLEQWLDDALRKTRARKTEIMLEAAKSFHKQEKQLRVENEALQMKIDAAALNEKCQEDQCHPTGASLELQFIPEADQRDSRATSPEKPMLIFL